MVEEIQRTMAGCNYYPSKADPCLFIKKANGDEPLSLVIIYVVDGGIEGIKEVIEALSKSFKVKTMCEMSKFVG
jgi:hypothetical protein